MAVELAAAYISLVPSTKGIGRSLARELDGPLEAAGRSAGDKSASAFGSRFTAGLKNTAKQAGIALGVAFGAAGTYGVKVAADFQQTRIAFSGILGSAEEADKRLRELQKFAAGTPFEFAGLAESAQQLLAVGFTADDIIPTMTTLGNVAATLGVGEAEIKGVVRALGQMRGKGKASAEELQQISEQIPGFSAIGAIAEDMGISTAEAFKKLEKGAIPADKAIESILNGMESFPGAAGAMERQSKTLNGVLSTFKDTINIALIQGIEPFLPAISGALTNALPLIERFIEGTVGGVSAVVTGFGDMADAIGGFFEEINRGDVGGGIAVELGGLVGLAEDHGLVTAFATALSAVGDGAQWAYEGLAGIAGFAAAEFAALVRDAGEAWSEYATLGIGPVAEKIADVKGLLSDVNALFQEQRDILIPLAGAATGLAVAFAAFQIIEGVQAAITAFNLFAPILAGIGAAVATPLLVVAGVVLAIAGAFAAAYIYVQPFRDAVDGLIDTIGDLAIRAGAFVSELVDRALPALSGFASTIADIGSAIAAGFSDGLRAVGGAVQRHLIRPLRPLGRFIKSEILPAFSAFGDFVSALFARLADVAEPIIIALSTAFEFLAGVISDALGPAFDILTTAATAAFDIVRTVIESFVNILAPALGLAFDAAAAAIDIAWGVIVGVIQAAFGIIEGIFDVFTGILTADFGKVWEGLVEIVGGPIGAIRDIFVNTFEEIITFLGGVPGRIGDFVTAIFGGAIDTAEAVFGGMASTATTAFEGILTFLGGLPARVSDAVEGMWDGIAEGFESVINFIIDAWNDLDMTAPKVHIPGTNKDFGGFTVGLPHIDRVDFAHGGIVRATPGGIIGRLGEAGRDEAVVPLPPNFDISKIGAGGDTHLHVTPEASEDLIDRAMRELNWHRQIQLAVASR